MACTWSFPVFRAWPWVWVAPLVAYFLVVGCILPLRRSLVWLRVGRTTPKTAGAAVLAIFAVALALVTFQVLAQPELSRIGSTLPVKSLGGILLAGVVFTILNATLEELVFRGILFDALDSEWESWVALFVTSILFALGHTQGYPSGLFGACMAGAFGLIVGGLRWWTGGLALPVVVHMGADATIYCILAHSGAL